MLTSVSHTFLASLLFIGLTACGGGSGESGGGATPPSVPLPPPPPPPSTEFTIRGVAFKGLLQGANVYVYSADELFDDNPVAIGNTNTSSFTGNFSVTVDTANRTIGDNVVVAVLMKNATMECDAPNGCALGVDFGDDFELPKESITNESSLGDPFFLAAVLPTPAVGTRRDISVNIFTHMQVVYYNSLLSSTSFPNESELLARSQTRVASLFGLQDEDFTQLSFLDITASIFGDVDENDILAAFISGGIQGAIGEGSAGIEDNFFNFLGDFLNQGGELLINEGSSDSLGQISLQDIYENAIAIENVNPQSANAPSVALQDLKNRKAEIDNSPAFSLTRDGEL